MTAGAPARLDREALVAMRRVRDRMDRDDAQPLDLEALARTVHRSSGTVSRQFRAAYGETPYRYLMTRRLERAMLLPRRGDGVRDAAVRDPAGNVIRIQENRTAS